MGLRDRFTRISHYALSSVCDAQRAIHFRLKTDRNFRRSSVHKSGLEVAKTKCQTKINVHHEDDLEQRCAECVRTYGVLRTTEHVG